ncbi:MAG: methyltransferase domain-containing protein [Balneolaceae bacterium]
MPLFLHTRNTEARELMDYPHCDPDLLDNTYMQFSTVNRLIGGWQWMYKHYLRPVIKNAGGRVAVLDIGCGGGDIIALLNQMILEDGFQATFTGIDPDPRAIRFAREKAWPQNMRFLKATSSELAQQNDRFDIVLSNHLLHHLTTHQIQQVSGDAVKLCKGIVLFSDIERSDLGYATFSLISPLLFRNSFISADGATSIKRSFTQDELIHVLPDKWSVQKKFPFRLMAIFRQGENNE